MWYTSDVCKIWGHDPGHLFKRPGLVRDPACLGVTDLPLSPPRAARPGHGGSDWALFPWMLWGSTNQASQTSDLLCVVTFEEILTSGFYLFILYIYFAFVVLLPGKFPWMEEPGGLQSMGSRIGHDWATSLSLFTLMHWRRKWQPTPAFLPGESQGRGSLVGCHFWGCTESDMTEAT